MSADITAPRISSANTFFWKRLAKLTIGVTLALTMCSAAFSQESVEERIQRLEKEYQENLKNAENLQKQKHTLLKLLESPAGSTSAPTAPVSAPMGAGDVRNIVSTYLQEKEAKQKAAETSGSTDADGCYKIGSNLDMSATWQNGVVFSTPNNDFTMHIGGWMQYDNVFWSQSPGLRTAQGKAGPAPGIGSGAASGGIGDLQDGSYFRRIRLQANGVFWENFEYNLTFSFENIQYSSVGMDEFWVGATNIPILGTVRVGHVKNAVGLEGNWTASSKAMTFMEQSAYGEAIQLNEYDVTGIWVGNNYLDERVTWSGTFFRPDFNATTSADFGDGTYGAQGRLTALPIYDCDGRHLMHLGLSGGWRAGSNNINSTTPNGNLPTFDLRARSSMRDDDPAGSPSGAQALPNANSNRMIDTGNIVALSDFVMGTEFLYILGPLSLQAEYGLNFVDNASGFLSSTGVYTKLKTPQSYTFQGGYVQLAYTLTGENRSYEKRLGRLDSYYFGRQGLRNNAWFVRDEDGHLNVNYGAWEIAARYDCVDLNDGSGATGVQGGIMDSVTLGLNWYLNDNMKIGLNYAYDHRYDLPATTIPGSTRGLGIRVQFVY